MYPVDGDKHGRAAKGNGNLSICPVGKLDDLLQHLGRQNIEGVVFIPGQAGTHRIRQDITMPLPGGSPGSGIEALFIRSCTNRWRYADRLIS